MQKKKQSRHNGVSGKCNKNFQNTTRTQQERTFNWTFMPIESDTTHCREFETLSVGKCNRQSFSFVSEIVSAFIYKLWILQAYMCRYLFAMALIIFNAVIHINSMPKWLNHAANVRTYEDSFWILITFMLFQGDGVEKTRVWGDKMSGGKDRRAHIRVVGPFRLARNAFHITLNESTWTSA